MKDVKSSTRQVFKLELEIDTLYTDYLIATVIMINELIHENFIHGNEAMVAYLESD